MKRLIFATLVIAVVSAITEAKYSGGSGNANNPYQISTVADLLALAADTNDYNKCFVLTADINLASYSFTTAVIAHDTNNSNYVFDGNAFTGIFDGAGHKIINLTINTNGVGNWFLGLFGYLNGLEGYGEIKNLGLENISVANGSGEWVGSGYIGGIVGYNYGGSISNCYSKGVITSGANSTVLGGLVGYNYYGTISNCSSTGDVTAGDDSYDLGGLAGDNSYGTIINCYSTGTVTGGYDSDYLGGLVGYVNYGYVTVCYATGEVAGDYDAGGLVGINDNSTITRCYSSGSVSGYMYVGGLLGWNYSGTTTDSFWDTNTSGQSWSAGGTGKTTVEMKTKSTFTDAGWNFVTIWDIVEGQTYPFFKSGGGTGTPDDPYRIATKADLLAMAGTTADYDKCFILTADINIEGQVFTTAIIGATNFTGTFDGNGHKIANFTINGGDYLGLFGQISDGGSVKNLGIENFAVSGHSLVGGLAGWNDGSISNCYSTGAVNGGDNSQYLGGLVGYNYFGTITNCYSTGVVTGGDNSQYLGGLVGRNSGSISDCYATGSVSGTGEYPYVGGLVGYNNGGIVSNCYSTGAVTAGGDYSYGLGGLVGQNGGIVSDCYSTGAVTGGYDSISLGGLVGYNHSGTISNCYSTGSVSGDDEYTGGLCGVNENGSISSSYFLITSGLDNGYGEPLTDAQMKQQSSFAGWDFVWETINGPNDIWAICEDVNYPKLAWQFLVGDSDNDKDVDFIDFAAMGLKWQQADSTLYCGGSDLTGDGVVNMNDLDVFVDNWLWE